MKNTDERLETALQMIEMHLGIYLAKEDIQAAIDKSEKRKDRTKRFGDEMAKMDANLRKHRSEEYEEEFIRIYTDLERNTQSENKK